MLENQKYRKEITIRRKYGRIGRWLSYIQRIRSDRNRKRTRRVESQSSERETGYNRYERRGRSRVYNRRRRRRLRKRTRNPARFRHEVRERNVKRVICVMRRGMREWKWVDSGVDLSRMDRRNNRSLGLPLFRRGISNRQRWDSEKKKEERKTKKNNNKYIEEYRIDRGGIRNKRKKKGKRKRITISI